MVKTCIKCGETKDESLFIKDRNTCKLCRNIRHALWRKNNPEKEKRHKELYFERHKEKELKRMADKQARYRERNREKSIARWAVWSAKQIKELESKPCEKCNSNINIEAHHFDYTKPLDVIWLCRDCHNKIHK